MSASRATSASVYSVPIAAPRHRPAPTAARADSSLPRRSAQAAATHIAAITCPKRRLAKGSSNVPTISAIATTVACRGYTVATVRRMMMASTIAGTVDDHRVTHHSPRWFTSWSSK